MDLKTLSLWVILSEPVTGTVIELHQDRSDFFYGPNADVLCEKFAQDATLAFMEELREAGKHGDVSYLCAPTMQVPADKLRNRGGGSPDAGLNPPDLDL